MEPIVIRLGTLRLSGPKVEFEPAERTRARAPAGHPIRLIVDYDYVEPTADKDTTRIHVTARRGREALGEATHVIEDHPIADDSSRYYLALDAHPRERGRIPGKFDIKIRYERSTWGTAKRLEVHDFAHEGQFDLEVE